MASASLHGYLEYTARRRPQALGVVDVAGGRQVSHGELDGLSNRLRDRLRQLGVRPRDRVGIYLPKSIDSVAAVFAILKTGAAYVPVDPTAPPARNAYIFTDCAVSAALVDSRHADALREALGRLGFAPRLIVLDWDAAPSPLEAYLAGEDAASGPAPEGESAQVAPDDLAYLLYTSGSTGNPKGVMLSHRNGTSFVDWCTEVLAPNEQDRFSSHAPFHFDLSILDIYVPLKHGAALFLVGEELGKNPAGMVAAIAEHGLTVWYSTPSVLTLLLEHGGLEGMRDHALRLVVFAGEVFPVKHLRRFKHVIAGPRYLNLYGPTETNVCTYHEIPEEIPEDRVRPFPIGRACSHVEARVVDGDGRDVARGEEGELVISGAPVMQGYWNLPERSASAFLPESAGRWYRTGDLVVEGEDGVYAFRGRRDRMVKRRGFRIELGEIEAALYRHPAISEAAAIALSDEQGVTIKVFYVSREGAPLSLIALKRFCVENLPHYMIPDRFSHQPVLPKTSTDKIDYQTLKGVE